MNKEYIWLFGRKVRIVEDSTYTCTDCALKDICDNNLIGVSEICGTGDGTSQKFVKAD